MDQAAWTVLRDGRVAGHHGTDPGHLAVVGGHDAAERDVVAGGRGRKDPGQLTVDHTLHRLHA
jgi:hypothetical protein